MVRASVDRMQIEKIRLRGRVVGRTILQKAGAVLPPRPDNSVLHQTVTRTIWADR